MARILIVDDHRISRRFMAAALRQNGAAVKQAATVSHALSIALSWLPDVVVLDVRLGDDCGYDVAELLGRRWPAAVRNPDIFLLSAATA
ncbi:MAG TPA: response regulator, partial [Xanthomonadales bacterium]|nr:response regulator [Xanthomonadales bacterium]